MRRCRVKQWRNYQINQSISINYLEREPVMDTGCPPVLAYTELPPDTTLFFSDMASVSWHKKIWHYANEKVYLVKLVQKKKIMYRYSRVGGVKVRWIESCRARTTHRGQQHSSFFNVDGIGCQKKRFKVKYPSYFEICKKNLWKKRSFSLSYWIT